MFKIVNNKNMYITRGDIANIEVRVSDADGIPCNFQVDDEVRFQVIEKGDCNRVVLQKTVKVTEESEFVVISLSSADTKFCEVISKPKDYWYEVELNPNTDPQTLIGYDDAGPKIFRVYPEGVKRHE